MKQKQEKKTPLNKSKGITTGFYMREENMDLLKNEEIKQRRSLSWLVNNAVEKTYGGAENE